MTTAGFLYFLAMGSQFPVLPAYVQDELGGGSVAVGLSVGAFGLSSAVLRPVVGPLGDRRGRRFLVMFGGIVAGLAMAANVVADTVGLVITFRLLTGLGEAALFVGVAAAIQDGAPANRRGEAASYFSTAVYGGLAAGPLIGEAVFEGMGADAAFLVAGGLSVAGGLLGWWAPGRPAGGSTRRPSTYFHRGAIRPGLVLGVNLIAYAGFLSFIALYAGDVGITRSGTLFALFAGVVLAMRVFAARLPDRLGPVRTSTLGLSLSTAGLACLFVWQTALGAYLGVAVYAVGQSFMFPALFVVAVESAAPEARSHAIATFSFFFDAAVGLGGLFLGGVVALSDRPTAFGVGALICALDLVLLRRILGPALVPRPVVAVS